MRPSALVLIAGMLQLYGAEPIRIHPGNPHYFLFRGRATALITSGEHYGAVLNADIDYRRYLAALESAGLNYTRIFGGSYVEKPGASFGIKRNNLAPAPGRYIAPWARSETPGYAGGGNRFDLEHWNEAYFERFRAFLEDASRRGIVVELTFFTSQYGDAQWQLSPFHPSNNVNGVELADYKLLHTLQNGRILGLQERYVRRLVREAAGFDNVIFEIQNEPWSDRGELAGVVNHYLRAPGRDTYPNSVDVADQASVEWQARVARWIAAEEESLPAKHLIAQNYANFKVPVRALVPGAGTVNFHYAYPEAAAANYGLNVPVGYDETGFLGRADPVYRREAWNFMLSGGALFNNLDYSFTAGHEDGSDSVANGPGGGSAALRKQLGVLAKFLNEFPLAELRPDPAAVAHAGGTYPRVLSKPGKYYAAYFDGNGPCEVRLNLPRGDYRAVWINPETGEQSESAMLRHRGGEARLASPPFRDGVALGIRAARE
jgi:hypothetical protein